MARVSFGREAYGEEQQEQGRARGCTKVRHKIPMRLLGASCTAVKLIELDGG